MTSKSIALVKTVVSTEDLERLLLGEPVMYMVKNQTTKVKGRDPILVITPLSIYNADSSNRQDLFIALEGAGACHVPTQDKVKALDIFGCGLSMLASRQLSDRLNAIYNGEKNG